MSNARPKLLCYAVAVAGSTWISTWARKRNADRRARIVGGRVVPIRTVAEIDALRASLMAVAS